MDTRSHFPRGLWHKGSSLVRRPILAYNVGGGGQVDLEIYKEFPLVASLEIYVQGRDLGNGIFDKF